MKEDLKSETEKRVNEMLLIMTLAMMLAVVSLEVYLSNNPKQTKPKIIQEYEKLSIVNLHIIKKGTIRSSFITEYYLALSNDRVIFVTREDYEKYEENKYYSFELVEKTTVAQLIRLVKPTRRQMYRPIRLTYPTAANGPVKVNAHRYKKDAS